MKKIINKKNTYLLVLLVICLLGIVIVPTYAKFTSNYITTNDVVGMSLNFNLSISSIEEYEEIVVPAGDTESFNVEITNDTGAIVYYGVWYKMINPNIISSDISIGRVGSTSTTTSGSINNGNTVTVSVAIINNSSSSIKVNIGVASSSTGIGDIEYLSGKHLVTGTVSLPVSLTSYIVDLYHDGSAINIVNMGGSKSNPTVSLNATQGIMLDNNGEYRYYGSNPNNYVLFNGELWRIISISNIKSGTDDTIGEMRARIVRADSIGNYVWDSSSSDVNSGYGINDWTQADLMIELNTLYYNQRSGICFNDMSNGSITCDFKTIGLNADARNMIDSSLWYLGGISDFNGLYADDYYTAERTSDVYDCSIDDGACPRTTSWTGTIALMYASDYVYATDLSLCTKASYDYGRDVSTGEEVSDDCINNNWLLDTTTSQWTLSTSTTDAFFVFALYKNGYITFDSGVKSYGIRPSTVLKSNVVVSGGTGTSSDPFILE